MNLKVWIGRFERCFICGKIFYHRGESLFYSLSCEDYTETACRKCSKKDLKKNQHIKCPNCDAGFVDLISKARNIFECKKCATEWTAKLQNE